MKTLKIAVAATAAAGLLLGATAAVADGAALYTAKLCVTCHGADAKAPIAPNYPKLAGQNAAYCEQQVKDIRDGKRANGMTSAMKPLVAAVTDPEVTELCAWIASK